MSGTPPFWARVADEPPTVRHASGDRAETGDAEAGMPRLGCQGWDAKASRVVRAAKSSGMPEHGPGPSGIPYSPVLGVTEPSPVRKAVFT